MAPAAEGADPVIEFAADIEMNEPVGDAALRELLSQLATFGKPARLLGWDDRAGTWRVLDRSAHGDCRKLQAALQLVNRAGPVHAPQLNGFCDAVRAWAGVTGHRWRSQIPLPRWMLRANWMRFAVKWMWQSAECRGASGRGVPRRADRSRGSCCRFRPRSGWPVSLADAGGLTLFTMENHEPEPFSGDRLATMQTPGLTLLLDVPRVADGAAALDRMTQAAVAIAEALGGFVVDDNRVPLQDAGVARIKAQLQRIYTAMAERRIPAGSLRAQRLFA